MIKKDEIQERIQTMQAANVEYDEEFARIGKAEADLEEAELEQEPPLLKPKKTEIQKELIPKSESKTAKKAK
jgi:hypothetical protein